MTGYYLFDSIVTYLLKFLIELFDALEFCGLWSIAFSDPSKQRNGRNYLGGI
jgi:hypothetical protein